MWVSSVHSFVELRSDVERNVHFVFRVEPVSVSKWNGGGSGNSFRPIGNDENSKPTSQGTFDQRSDGNAFGGTRLVETSARHKFDRLARSERGGFQSGAFRSGNDGNSRGSCPRTFQS